ncbi:MAG: copper-binding protein [Myxococcota bacterium]
MRCFPLPLLLLALLLVPACGGDSEPVHAVRGKVVKVLKDGGELVVDHEEIPGYMGAMQMSLVVGDPAQARDLAPGDKVRFTLHVAERGAWIDGIERLPADTPLTLASPGH